VGFNQHCSACIGFGIKVLIDMGVTRRAIEKALAVDLSLDGDTSLI